MSGRQASLLLHKGVTGEVYYPPSKTWHAIQIDDAVHSLNDIAIKYTKRKNEWGMAHPDILRCLNVGDGSNKNVMIYQGMMSMCRDYRCESEWVDNLSTYRFGMVTAIRGNLKEAQIEFEFATTASSQDEGSLLPPEKIQARGSDLLYWAVPNNLVESEAALRMGVKSAKENNGDGEEEDAEEDEESDEEDNVLPPRKRRAPSKFIPESDSDSSSDSDSVDKELFPDSDNDLEEEVTDTDNKSQAKLVAKASTHARPARTWGILLPSSSLPSTRLWGTPSPQASGAATAAHNAWGVSIASEANSSSGPSGGWGHSKSVITPDSRSHDQTSTWSANSSSSTSSPTTAINQSKTATSSNLQGTTSTWGAATSSRSSGWGNPTSVGTPNSRSHDQTSTWSANSSSSTSGPTPTTAINQSNIATNSNIQGTTSTWGAATSSGSSGWGHPASVVTPDRRSHGQSTWDANSSSSSPPTTPINPSIVAISSNLQGNSTWGAAASSTSIDHNISSSSLQYRHPAQAYSRRTQTQYAVQSEGKLEIYRESSDDFFLRWYFGERIKIHEVGVAQCHYLDKTKELGGKTCTLVASKYEKQSARPSNYHASKFGGSPFIKAFYLVENPNGMSVQKELNAIANFGNLALCPGKLAARLELLVSTASCSPGKSKSPNMFELPAALVKSINLPDNASEGCGFIPCNLLEELLGGGNDGKNAIGIQVRIIFPLLGIFKGTLVRRAGITTIQLPNAMKKVDESTATKKGFKSAFLIINNVYPSNNNKMLERQLNPYSIRAPTKSSERDLKGIGTMITKILLGCGVPSDVFEEYNERSKNYDGRSHANLVGMCDCTVGGLPPGTVFVTGFGVGESSGQNIFITRSPCTEPGDAKVLPVVTEKPAEMSNEDWNHICGLSFGAVMFASPQDAESISLPASINKSDLDGDIYFCLWDPTMMPYLEERLLDSNQKEVSNEDNFEEYDIEGVELGDDIGDELLGAHVPLMIDGKTRDAIVASKSSDGNKYIVKYGEYSEIMSYAELMGDRDLVEEIVGHRGKGRNAEVEVLWEGNKRSWHSFAQMKEEVPADVAEYARQNDLLDTKGWCWCKDFVRDAEIVSLCSHRTHGRILQVEVMYDGDSQTMWKNAKSVDVDILVTYVEENNISLSAKKWKWLERSIQRAKKNWFATAQTRMSDAKRMAEYSRFIESLHRAYKKRGDINDKETMSLGRAFKCAIDIGKHGGRVPLEQALRAEIPYGDKFLKDV